MEHPIEEIPDIIHVLTQATPTSQKRALQHYFTPDANFIHPFCMTGSWDFKILGYHITSRWAILQIYQWYKLISPRIDLQVLSTAFDEQQLLLYVTIRQQFRLWMVPFYEADVRLTTVLRLAEGDETGPISVTKRVRKEPYSYAAVADPNLDANGTSRRKLYYITEQNDLYQTNEWIKFLVPWGVGSTLMIMWQLFATFLSILGAFVFFPGTWWKERSVVDFPPRKI